ncbi:siderophore-interacting protein [Brachybacterium sp. MASK1Z-5]|uniref:Siderophore-interacting protein n=1 Tax=Brachybacterium halotolerans TaxID=2795215 RepID=A0ABS1B873_9MICO|nr:siderophore-interacting protein [Brachybacterium halotolerans]MBK0330190.1 siderophore-interacting protein [Brachybacterium halotolerans]
MSDATGSGTAAPNPRDKGKRPPRPQAVLEVIGKQRITPNLLRVIVGGDQVSVLNDNDSTDKYLKLLLPQPGSGLQPPYDMEGLRETSPETLPSRRTYTVRSWDREKQLLALDFVLHGEGTIDGIAAAWADAVLPGDVVAANGAGGGYAPDPETGFHVLIGDHSALPAIASALEAMEPAARGIALVQLDHAEDQQDLDHPEGVELRWLIGDREQLVTETEGLDLPADGLQVFAHGERGIIKRIRRNLVKERGIDRSLISISAYWAAGRVEDQFQAEKREPVGRIDED